MRILILLAVRLYPKAWRARYGNEFEALIDDSGSPGFMDLLDVLKVAAWMRIAWLSPYIVMTGFVSGGLIATALAWVIVPRAQHAANRIPSSAVLIDDRGAGDSAYTDQILRSAMQEVNLPMPESNEVKLDFSPTLMTIEFGKAYVERISKADAAFNSARRWKLITSGMFGGLLCGTFMVLLNRRRPQTRSL